MQIQNAIDNSLKEINLLEDLDMIDYEQRKNVVGVCRQKLRLRGKISYSGYDLDELSNGYSNGFVELEKFNEIMAGRKSISTLEREVALLESLDLKVMIKRVNNYLYYVEAVRETL